MAETITVKLQSLTAEASSAHMGISWMKNIRPTRMSRKADRRC